MIRLVASVGRILVLGFAAALLTRPADAQDGPKRPTLQEELRAYKERIRATGRNITDEQLDEEARRVVTPPLLSRAVLELKEDDPAVLDEWLADPALATNAMPSFLSVAAAKGFTNIFERLIQQKADVNDVVEQYYPGARSTALHAAARGGQVEIVRRLLALGAKVDKRGFSNLTPLQAALGSEVLQGLWPALLRLRGVPGPPQTPDPRRERLLRQQEITALLLQQGADVFAPGPHSNNPGYLFEQAQNFNEPGIFDTLLTNATPLTARDAFGDTLLHYAARLGRVDSASMLIARRVDVNATNGAGFTPLQIAASVPHGDDQHPHVARYTFQPHLSPSAQSNRINVAEVLLQAGARRDAFSLTGLGLAAELAEFLTQNKQAALAVDADGRTPLHWAAAAGQTNAIEILLRQGASITAADKLGHHPLHEAAARAQTAALNFLLARRAPAGARDEGGRTPLHFAIAAADFAGATNLVRAKAGVNAPDRSGQTPLTLAAQRYSKPFVEFLLNNGASVKSLSNGAPQALHAAAAYGNADLVRLLIKKGADPHALSENGWTALHAAGYANSIPMMELLLDLGADINRPDKEGNTVLHLRAAQYTDKVTIQPQPAGLERLLKPLRANATLRRVLPAPKPVPPVQISVTRFLLDHKANPNATNRLGETPLHRLITRHGNDTRSLHELIGHLVGAGARLEALDRAGRTPLQAAIIAQKSDVASALLDRKAGLDTRDRAGQSILHHILTGRPPYDPITALNFAVTNGANVNLKDNAGCTPLHFAVTNGYQRTPLTKILLQAGARPNARDAAGRAPLHILTQEHYLGPESAETVTLLVKAGADPALKDARGRTFLHQLYNRPDGAYTGSIIASLLSTNKALLAITDENGDTPLHAAARAGHADGIRWLAEAGANPLATNKLGQTPIFFAMQTERDFAWRPLLPPEKRTLPGVFYVAEWGSAEQMKQIYELDPMLIHATNRAGQTVLEVASRNYVPARPASTNRAGPGGAPRGVTFRPQLERTLPANRTDRAATIAFLLEHGVNVDACTAVRIDRPDLLAVAFRSDPSATSRSYSGLPLLHHVVDMNSLDALAVLLTNKADVGVIDYAGNSPLGRALLRGQSATAELLRAHGARENIFDAVAFNRPDLLESLLFKNPALANATNSQSRSILGLASQRGSREMVGALLDLGARPGLFKITALHHAAVTSNNVEVGRLLLERGADKSVADGYGYTPLHYAAAFDRADFVALLLAVGADKNTPGLSRPGQPHGYTPLHLAALYGMTNTLTMLLAAGADVHATNSHGQTPLAVAKYHYHGYGPRPGLHEPGLSTHWSVAFENRSFTNRVDWRTTCALLREHGAAEPTEPK